VKRTSVGWRSPTQFVGNNIIISNTGQFVSSPMIWQLNDLPGQTDFITLFDEYKVNSITWRFMPRFTGASMDPLAITTGGAISSTLSLGMPEFMTAIDTDGGFRGTSLDRMLQYENVKFHKCQDMFTVTVKSPTAFGSVQTGYLGTTNNQQVLKNKWFAISSGSTGGSIDFYGLQCGVNNPYGEDAGRLITWAWDVYVTADVSFRHCK
jgi:hypothetical protein